MKKCNNDFKPGFCHSMTRFSRQLRWARRTTSRRRSCERWRTGRGGTVLSATGGRWASVCTRCCSVRRRSTPSRWWRRTARSWTTRCVPSCFLFVYMPQIPRCVSASTSVCYMDFLQICCMNYTVTILPIVLKLGLQPCHQHWTDPMHSW